MTARCQTLIHPTSMAARLTLAGFWAAASPFSKFQIAPVGGSPWLLYIGDSFGNFVRVWEAQIERKKGRRAGGQSMSNGQSASCMRMLGDASCSLDAPAGRQRSREKLAPLIASAIRDGSLVVTSGLERETALDRARKSDEERGAERELQRLRTAIANVRFPEQANFPVITPAVSESLRS